MLRLVLIAARNTYLCKMTSIVPAAPIRNCSHLKTIADVFYPVALGCTVLLFFFRLRAIYKRNGIVVGCFFVLCCGVLACTILLPVGMSGAAVTQTYYCMDGDISAYSYAAIIAPWVYDTLVFIAISWRLMQNASIKSGNIKENLQVITYGKYLPTLSKSLLLDGQRYYL